MLWWVLLSCWGKSIVQAELGRYTVSTGQTALQAFNQLPGRIAGRRGRVSWFIWFWLLSLVPTLIGGGGIYGAAGQAAGDLVPGVGASTFTLLLAAAAALIVFHGSYASLERLMTVMVVTFTLITLGCAVCLQLTERELTVLRQLAHGKTNREIAADLVVSEETVKTHVGNILSKLQMNQRTQAVIAALKQGLISLDEIEL
jgi:DNA-binding CsgD family transcriptional regulator